MGRSILAIIVGLLTLNAILTICMIIIESDKWILAPLFFAVILNPIMSGYLIAFIAKRAEVKHALIGGVIVVLIFLIISISIMNPQEVGPLLLLPFLSLQLLVFTLIIPFFAFGGYLRYLQVSKKKNQLESEKLLNEGVNLYEQKKFREAESKFKQALVILPSSETLMYNLALVYIELQEYKSTRNLINKIKKMDCQELILELEKKNALQA